MNSDRRGDLALGLYIAAAQLALTLFFAVLFVLLRTPAFSAALIGALIGLVASSGYALVSLRSGKESSAAKILLHFYLGQMVKWIIIVVSLTMTFKLLPDIEQDLNILVLLSVFLLTQSTYIFVPMTLKKDGSK